VVGCQESSTQPPGRQRSRYAWGAGGTPKPPGIRNEPTGATAHTLPPDRSRIGQASRRDLACPGTWPSRHVPQGALTPGRDGHGRGGVCCLSLAAGRVLARAPYGLPRREPPRRGHGLILLTTGAANAPTSHAGIAPQPAVCPWRQPPPAARTGHLISYMPQLAQHPPHLITALEPQPHCIIRSLATKRHHTTPLTHPNTP